MFIGTVANGYLEILNIRTVKLFSLWRDYGDNNDDVLIFNKDLMEVIRCDQFSSLFLLA